MSRLGWYARRLGTMSPAEIAWRAAAAGRTVTAGARPVPSDRRLLGASASGWETALSSFRAGTGRPVLLDRARAAAVAAAHPQASAGVVAAADRVVAGRVRYFGYPEVTLHRPVDWHLDPGSDVRWPAVASSRLDHRSAAGDAKWIWELNRLQHLPWLAQAWLLTGDDRYADTAWEHLDSWIAQNPPGVGIAWRGAFEAGVRAVSIGVALQGLRDSPALTADRYRTVVRVLAESARRCWTDRSRFSSANNHLVGELTGLAVVSLLLPELPGSARGLRRALRALAAEADRQILPDGAGAEQAFAYQIFTADLLLVVTALLRLDDRAVPRRITDALSRSAHYLAAVVGEGDPVPRYGDDDEGFALRLDSADVPDVRTHLAAVAAVTGDAVAAHYGKPGLPAAWLGGAEAAPVEAGPVLPPGDRYAPHGGLVVLRSGSRRVTVDVGPLGYLAIAAHGHADALAMTLAVDGAELIGDPGAGSYYGNPRWRRTHRGTSVHATVTVDEVDQSVAGGPFLWTSKAAVRVHGVDLGAGVVDAEHDGYDRLPDPVRHRRWVIAPPGAATLLVVDLLTGRGEHEARTAWPLHPALTAEPAGEAVHVVRRDGVAVLHIAHAATAPCVREEVRGDEAGGRGWWSQRLEAREPSWLVGSVARGPAPLVLTTALHLPDGSDIGELAVTAHPDRIEIGWREDGALRGATVHTDRPGAVVVTPASMPG